MAHAGDKQQVAGANIAVNDWPICAMKLSELIDDIHDYLVQQRANNNVAAVNDLIEGETFRIPEQDADLAGSAFKDVYHSISQNFSIRVRANPLARFKRNCGDYLREHVAVLSVLATKQTARFRLAI